MSRKVEIPETDLREMIADYHTVVERIRDMGVDWDSTLAWELFDAYLPPPPKPVTKDTAWGTRITKLVHGANVEAVFVGLNPVPEVEADFYAVLPDGHGATPLSFKDWYEAPANEAQAESEPRRVPVKVGQKRRHPDTGQVWEVTERRAIVGAPAFRIVCGAGATVVFRSALEQWEVVE